MLVLVDCQYDVIDLDVENTDYSIFEEDGKLVLKYNEHSKIIGY